MIRLAIILTLIASPAWAISWTPMASGIKERCGNYCDVSGTRTADSNNGSSATGDFWWGYFNSVQAPVKAISRDQMRRAGIRDSKGRIVDYIRTIGLDGDRAMLHVGAGLTGYMPVYAERRNGEWRPQGPARINGAVPYAFSSSMAYAFDGGTHWMIQDYPRMQAYRSTDGVNWKPVGGMIGSDAKAAYPDMIRYGGRWHLVYTVRWDNGTVRHLSAETPAGPWRVEANNALYAFKGCNLFVADGLLRCHSNGKVWQMSGGSAATASGSPCSAPAATGGSGSITVTWSGGGKCVIKIVGPTDKWLSGQTSGVTIGGLTAGTYKVRVKPSGGVYSDVTGVVVR